MKPFNTSILLILCSLLFSCTLIKVTPEALNQDIQRYLENNEFDKIDAEFRKIDANDPAYKSTLDQQAFINEKRQHYINTTSAAAIKLQQSDGWQHALDTYNIALEKINNQPLLSKEKAKLLLARDEQVTSLRKDMLMKRADALASYKIIYEKLHKLIPKDYSAKFDINRYNNDRIEVARQLNLCGDQARSQERYILARDCYSLSNQLAPTKKKRYWVNNINKTLKNQTRHKRDNKLLAAYKSAYAKNDFNKARKQLKILLSQNPSHKKAKHLLMSLETTIGNQVSTKLDQGKALYSKKKINEALSIWQQALHIDPENKELLRLINRAEKVSKKIKSLEANQ